MKSDVIIIGGGAAGLMCAIEAGKRGRRVTVIEHSERLGKKILISGGGRCNFTNLHAGPENYLSSNPHFCKSALSRYTPADFIALVQKHGIAFHEKKLGQLFCDFSSKQIVEMLESECRATAVQILVNCRVESVQPAGQGFRVETSQGAMECSSLVIATGGLSFPKIGATDFSYRIARQFDLKIVQPRPGLVPLVPSLADGSAWFFQNLSGISLSARVSAGSTSFDENVLFTHRGLSGPAILQISSYCPLGGEFEIDLLPATPALDFLKSNRQGGRDLKTILGRHLPQRFVQEWCERSAPGNPLGQWSNTDMETVARQLAAWRLRVAETEGYSKAEVTMGGVDTAELSSKTMASRKVSGLYFIGEAVDVTGWLGGYNFQWAWASGFAAGQSV